MVMLQETIGSVVLLWKTWSIHGFVLFSLCLQIFLFLAAPFRKKSTNVGLVVLIWSAYLLVGTAINRALALIYSANKQQAGRAELVDLYSFWCAFMFLHFGGPDTITAYAVEDNELWARNWPLLFSHVVAAFNAVVTVPLVTLFMWRNVFFSESLVLIAGLLKSIEKIMSLSNASFRKFYLSLVPKDPDPGPDYAAAVEDHDLYIQAGIPAKFDEIQQDEPAIIRSAGGAQTDLQVVIHAVSFFDQFKGMYVDMVFCCHERKQSMDLFLRLTSHDAFRILETEMKLAYETFYTKTPYISTRQGKLIRFLSFLLLLVALLFWCLQHKNRFRPIDVKITNTLLAGAISIDFVAYIRLHLSDRKIARAAAASSGLPCFSGLLLHTRRRRWGESREQETTRCQKLMRVLFRQWSESIKQFNFIDVCIYDRPEWRKKLFTVTGAKDIMDEWRFVSKTWFTNDLRDFIFEELKSKSLVAEDLGIAEEVSSSRGTWVLRCNSSCNLDPTTFQPWIMDVEFDESVLIWHIATELCYQTEAEVDDNVESQHCRFSKILSDYMFYLLLRQPNLMFEMAPMASVIFNDTSEQAKEFFRQVMASSLPNAKDKSMKKDVHTEACRRILEVRTDLPPSYIMGESKSVLFLARQLAKCLKELKTKGVDQWRFTSQIWVELLCYAAAQSPARFHVTLLGTGGELVTLVRLLMLHLGLSKQFQKAETSPTAELVVGI